MIPGACRVHVIGDSISIHYGPHLRALLPPRFAYSRKGGDAALADLDRAVGANGGDSAMVLDHLRQLGAAGGLPADILLLNCGLHDIKTDPATGRKQVAISAYEANLRAIVAEVRALGLRLVWLSTTPCDEAVHNTRQPAFHRFAADCLAYNAVAARVMAEAGVPCVDMHDFTARLGPDLYCDHVHFRPEVRVAQAAFLAGWLEAAFPGDRGTPTSVAVMAPLHAEDRMAGMDAGRLESRRREALRGLERNTRLVHGFDRPVLNEAGPSYPGIWLECGPLEALVYGRYAPQVAVDSHEVFFHHQRADGYLPCWVFADRVGASQIQQVVPIAATALETAELTGDEQLLERAYAGCARWDAWLRRHRDTRGTGLCEAFCTYDTGHDNSPRFAGLPCRCAGDDAACCPRAGRLPYLAPDLSATVYGGRRALAAMARRLGRPAEEARWLEDAERIRQAILTHCFDPEDECFYDRDLDGRLVRIRGDVLTRVLGEHVVDQAMFERIYARHIRNPAAFWTPYPLPSIAIDDPAFVRPIPDNSWGGAAQALTALRAPRWFLHYGKEADLRHLMTRWVEAILAAPGFRQQLDPLTGAFSTAQDYSPTMCVLLDFADRLAQEPPCRASPTSSS